MTWLATTVRGITLKLHIQPRASTTGIVGPHGDALKIRLAAPPVDGAANAELIAFLAKRLGVPKSAVRVQAGATGRRKTVAVDGISVEEAAERLRLG
jgi:uncharacterized protein (TIGR00251 family)